MAGHNKWSKIKHKKGAADAKRSKVWTKIIREITVAAKLGGEDPSANPRLRKAIDDARAANMPKENIARAVSKGSGSDETQLEELVYEGYGPGGVAIVIECLTDNRNRTGSDVRTIVQKKGGNMGSPGSVLFSFKKKGVFTFEKESAENKNLDEDKLLEFGLEYGLEDVSDDNDCYTVFCAPENYLNLKDQFEKSELKIASAEVTMIPDNMLKVSGDNAQKLIAMIDALEDHDDVQNVYSNMDIDENELMELMA